MLLAIIPPAVDMSPIIGHITDEITKLSHCQFYFYPSNSVCQFQCHLSIILGDSPASNSLIGMRGPTCSHPCRICNIEAVDLGTLPNIDLEQYSVDDVEWKYRQPRDLFDLVADVQQGHKHGMMEIYESKLKQYGSSYYPVNEWRVLFVLIMFA